MASIPFPPTALASTSTSLLFASGSTLHLIDTTLNTDTPSVCSASSSSTAADVPSKVHTAGSKVQAAGLIRVIAVNADGTTAVSAGDDKSLCVWDIGAGSLSLQSTRQTIKKVADLSFAPDGSIIVTDKVGDAYLYPLKPRPTEDRPKGFALQSDPSLNPDADYLLGHVSVVSQLVLTPDAKFLITADRDEHIRVSRFPKAYVVERYLFGSEGFVSAIHIPRSQPNILLSAGGESTMQIWDWQSGSLLSRVEIGSIILPHRRVRPQARKIKNKKRAALPQPCPPSNDPTSEGWFVPPEGFMYPSGQGVCIRAISSITVGEENATAVVFSSEGCTAVHSFILPAQPHGSLPTVHSLSFPYPVLGFTTLPGTAASTLVVALDSTWGVTKSEADIDSARAGATFVIVNVDADGSLSDASSSHAPLLSTLTTALSSPALLAEHATLASLSLYPNMSLFPRWPGFEEDEELAGPAAESVAASTAAVVESASHGGGGLGAMTHEELAALNLRQLGRLRAQGVDTGDLIPKKKKQKRGNPDAADADGASTTAAAPDAGIEADVGINEEDAVNV